MNQGHIVCHLCDLRLGRWSSPKYLAERIHQMDTNRDGVAEGNDEAELGYVVACALITSATSLPWAGSPGLWLCLVEKSMPARSRRTPEIKQSPTVAPSVPFLYVKSPFSSKVTSVQRPVVFYEELSFKGTDILQSSFFVFPVVVCKALASLSLLSLKCHVLGAIPSFSFGKEGKAGLSCCNNSCPRSLRMPCVVFWSQTYFWFCDT